MKRAYLFMGLEQLKAPSDMREKFEPPPAQKKVEWNLSIKSFQNYGMSEKKFPCKLQIFFFIFWNFLSALVESRLGAVCPSCPLLNKPECRLQNRKTPKSEKMQLVPVVCSMQKEYCNRKKSFSVNFQYTLWENLGKQFLNSFQHQFFVIFRLQVLNLRSLKFLMMNTEFFDILCC